MPKRHKIQTEKCALLVIDMQKYFCDQMSDACVPDAGVLMKRIQQLIRAFRKQKQPIFFTRHIDDTEKGSLMFEWWSQNILADDPYSVLSDDLSVGDDVVLDKHQYDAFLYTDLEAQLKKRDITQVVVCGVLTNLCCETTARAAFMRGFHVFFLDDGTRTYTDDMHKATLLNLSYGFATIVNTQDVLRALGT
jgi:isochorismate hydrolase